MLNFDTATVINEYEKNGFAVIRDVLDPALVAEAREHIEWLGRRYPRLRPEEYHHPLMRNDAFWVRLVTDERLVDIAELILGSDLACFTSHYVCKPPRDGLPVLWHQDGAYWKLQPMEALTVWAAIDESTTENGCLRIIPGSHELPIHTPQARTDVTNMLYSQTREELVRNWSETAGTVDIELQPGDVSIHHPNILHSSEANTSEKRRCGLDIGYIATSTLVANEGLYMDPILVRGTPGTPGAAANQYRNWPPYSPEESIVFQGCEGWNAKVAEVNARGSFVAPTEQESPLETTRRMVQRLEEGTVSR
ncbi:phytanoyl-CoA dioxygenase family protein [Streptomyces sioyaensis]|uniref:phytanoyl-CoA dioxygenase family protein n=1 Tax=Streptomyces sioyaensis TaxID=67364 RepID=UPI001F1C3DDF|nr:phytanoyl-CoA dioxygenase family protein [Streptomyces sioyaensis]MCF3172864.1 phytanoyl-CoA dioxygenase family protein [Streptomyces sioyaensis]